MVQRLDVWLNSRTLAEKRVKMIQKSRFGAPKRLKSAQLTDMLWLPPALRIGPLIGDPAPRKRPNGRLSAQFCNATDDFCLPFVEIVGVDQAERHLGAWTELAGRALEPNIFLQPSFALSAARHLAGGGTANFLLAWDQTTASPRSRLLALWPIAPRRAFFGSNLKTWVHDYCCSGAPLLDKAQAFVSLDAIVSFLNVSISQACALTTSQLKKDGPTFALFSRYATAKGLEFKVVSQYDRAALDATPVGVSAGDLVSSKKKKELQRQFRRLSEKGPITFGISRDAQSLRQQIESFLVLEAKGWKGRAGGAFLNQPELATFLRIMTRTMGRERKCRVHWMACGEKIIAANIVLLGDDSAYFWKTAYDEDFASTSPGVLLTMNMTDALLREPRVFSADSCAVPDHPMIDHIWRGRLSMADTMLSLGSDKVRAFNGAVQREKFRLRLREKAKSALTHLKLA